MDAVRSASVTSARVRTDAAFKNRWQTLFKNPKILIIAFFASYVLCAHFDSLFTDYLQLWWF